MRIRNRHLGEWPMDFHGFSTMESQLMIWKEYEINSILGLPGASLQAIMKTADFSASRRFLEAGVLTVAGIDN